MNKLANSQSRAPLSIAPISAVIATRNRAMSLARTFDSLLEQELVPAELIVVDASDDEKTKRYIDEFRGRVADAASVFWCAAEVSGAASQRNQGVARATQPFVWFFDDDIVFEPNCAQRLWSAISSDGQLGGVNAMIVNQAYHPPGVISRTMFTLMHGRREKSFAGRVIGPAITFLPEDRDNLPEVVRVEWLNTTCTIYRREALPSPAFDPFFTGYSLGEDVALAVTVGKHYQLGNVRTARIYHESSSKASAMKERVYAEMETVNRHFLMTRIMRKQQPTDYFKLMLFELFNLIAGLRRLAGWKVFPAVLVGKVAAALTIAKNIGPKARAF
jgi:glycosyltransferase involved in cell wall biosynthesis